MQKPPALFFVAVHICQQPLRYCLQQCLQQYLHRIIITCSRVMFLMFFMGRSLHFRHTDANYVINEDASRNTDSNLYDGQRIDDDKSHSYYSLYTTSCSLLRCFQSGSFSGVSSAASPHSQALAILKERVSHVIIVHDPIRTITEFHELHAQLNINFRARPE